MKKLIVTSCVLLLGLCVKERAAFAGSLLDAYKKEFAFLEAEKSALKKRIGEVEKESSKKIAAAEAEVETLQQQILGARARADEIEGELLDVERQTATADERTDLLAETIDRAFDTLSRHGVDVPSSSKAENEADQAEQIETIFALSGQLLEKTASVTSKQGVFFDADGTQRAGTVVNIGKVAAFGISKEASGALAPAGAGRLKIWPEEASASARAVLENKPMKTLSLFLFESLEKGVDEKKAKTPYEVVDSGGVIGWVIVGLGLVGLFMVFLRIVILLRAGSRTDRLLVRVKKALSQGSVSEALEICKKAKGSAARVMKAVVQNLDRSRDHLEDIVSEAILHEAPHIERFGSTVTVIAAVAPLLGLLGTVTGMISTFDIITEYGTGDPKMLSGGISEALVTTELGLIVAIPMLLIGTLLGGRASSILQTLERAALQILNLAEQPEVKNKRVSIPASPPQGKDEKTPNGKKPVMTPAAEAST